MLPGLMNMIARLLSGLGPIGTVLLALLPFVGYYVMKQRAGSLAASVEHLQGKAAALEASLKAAKDAAAAAAKRRTAAQKAEEAAAAAKAKADEEAAAAVAAAAANEAVIAETKRKKGTAAAASARAKQLKAAKKGTASLVLLAVLCSSTESRAEACVEGFPIKKDEVAKCDAECMPEDELELLLEDSLQCDRLRIEHDTVLKKHSADVTSFSTKLSLCDQHVAKLEADIARLTPLPPKAETATGSYLLAGLGILLVGAALGVVTVRQLDR